MPLEPSTLMPRGRPRNLPWMTNQQFDEVESFIAASSKKKNRCPTCGTKAVEVAPGVTEWGPSTYHYKGEDRPCNCEEQETLYRHYLLARIPQEYMTLSIEDDYYGDQKALKEAQDYLANWENYRNHGMSLGFYSKTQGTGKTFLATYLARELVKRGESVYFVNFRHMVSALSLPYDARKDEERRLYDCTVLILDEIPATALSDAQRNLFAEKFEELVRHRSNYNKVTMLTTNLTPKELDQEYSRAYSLLAAKEKSIQVAGDDARRTAILSVNAELALNGETRPIQ